MKPDINNMTLNEYLMYQGRNKGLERSCISSKSVAPVRNRILVYPDSDEEDEDLDEILDDLFKIGAENLRKMEHEVPNRRDNVNDFKDYDQEDGKLPDLPTFSTTDEFVSNSEQVEENIDIAEEK
ncbi:hypothetical protein Tco_1042051 [Tanacetum coccineum]|uniref:Uncharacterized protein n=1 Tax=Tanacetum coccineum TaxID=301880 RepID=A0ABQ5GJE6_9ASTR